MMNRATTHKRSGGTFRMVQSVALATVLVCAVAGMARAAGSVDEALPMQPLDFSELRAQAVNEVVAAARSNSGLLRTHAAEAAQFLGTRAAPVLQLALEDDLTPVRFAALATIGRARIASLASEGHRFLGHPDGSVRAAAIFALHENGLPVDLSPLSALLASDDPAVRGNTVMLIGWMGDKSAVPMLRDMVKTATGRANPTRDAIVRLQFAEAMAQLGDEEAMVPVRANAYSKMGEVRVLALTIMGEIGDYKMQPAVAAMLNEKEPVELRLAAATALARMEDMDGQLTLLKGAAHADPLVRAQAASGLGYLSTEAARQALAFMLSDQDATVRLAAATGLLRHLAGRQ